MLLDLAFSGVRNVSIFVMGVFLVLLCLFLVDAQG